MNAPLAIFLLFDVFVIGVVATVATRHAMAHFNPDKHDLEKTHPQPQGGHLPPAVREQMLAAAQAEFQAVLKQSTTELRKDLDTAAQDIKKQLERLESETAKREREHYEAMLTQLQQQTKQDVDELHQNLAGSKEELKAKLTEEIAAEKQRLLQQIDTKLADAVGSFLLESLQHNVDLGAQTAYLTSMLEEHKADFKQEVGDHAEESST